MNVKTIYEELQQLEQLVAGWGVGEPIPSIERDLALDKLKALYEAVRFARSEQKPVEKQEEKSLQEPIQEPIREPAESMSIAEPKVSAAAMAPLATWDQMPLEEEEPLAFDLDEVMGFDAEEPMDEKPLPEPEPVWESEPEEIPEPEQEAVAEPESEQEAVAEPEPEPEVVAEPESEPEIIAEPKVEPTPEPVLQNSLFGAEEIPVHRRGSRRVLMSLYGEAPVHRIEEPKQEPKPKSDPKPQPQIDPKPEPKEEPQPQPIPEPQKNSFEEPKTVLGEVIYAEQRTLADTIVAAPSVASTLAVGSLREMIALNDRFLLISELFGGDKAAYEEALTALEEQPSLDDCMIYIAENYLWNPNSAGAKLLFDLLERKYGEN